MTYDERKAWLRRYQDALSDYRMATARLEEANTQATKCTASVSSTLGRGGTSDRAFCWNLMCCIWTIMHKSEKGCGECGLEEIKRKSV